MLEDLRKLYDTFKTLGQLNLTHQYEQKKPEVNVLTKAQEEVLPKPTASGVSYSTSPQSQEPVASASQPEAKPEPEIVASNEPQITPEAVAEKEHEIIYKPEPEPISGYANLVTHTPEVEKTPEAKPAETHSDPNPEPSHSMLADRFNSGSKSLSETIAPTPSHGLGARLHYQPITDLSTGICLNEKFSFVSELFGNNPVQYEEAISRMNKAVNVDEAIWILEKYHSSEWAQKQDTLARMKEFVKRRFI
jgi:hypothetical protein